jgi:RNA polymerase sigma-70 factor, ECF subfamily
MPEASPDQITQLLIDWSKGDKSALDKLVPVVYEELRRLARHFMSGENPGHTLQTTALVNEAYLRLADQRRVSWQNRAHFFAISGKLMRRILLDHARRHARKKRGGDARKVQLDEVAVISQQRSSELIALDDALRSLEVIDPRRAQVVELRYFGGLSVEETSEVLKVAPNTVVRDWNLAKVWLYQEMTKEHGSGS